MRLEAVSVATKVSQRYGLAGVSAHSVRPFGTAQPGSYVPLVPRERLQQLRDRGVEQQEARSGRHARIGAERCCLDSPD